MYRNTNFSEVVHGVPPTLYQLPLHMSDPVSLLYNYVRHYDTQREPQHNIQYAFEYSEREKGFRAQVTVFGHIFAGRHYHARKQKAKEEASAIALEQLYNRPTKNPQPQPRSSATRAQQQSKALESRPIDSRPAPPSNIGGSVPLSMRVVQWLEQTYRERQYNPYKPQTALLNELVQILGIESPRYEVDHVYHNIGSRTHAPFACTLFIDGFIFKSPEPVDTVQAAKDSCASQAIYSLVQTIIGNGDKAEQARNLNLVTDKEAQRGIISNDKKISSNCIIIIGDGKPESAMLNELAAKCGWNTPTYEYEESRNSRNATVFRCVLTLHRGESADERICGTEWCVSKNQAKHDAASVALAKLINEGVCRIVRNT